MSKLKRGRLLGVDRVRVGLDTGTETLVQQQFKDEVDMTKIIQRFGLGQAPAYVPGVYGDFTGIVDFYSAREAVERAERSFQLLPAEARDKFDNDPGKFLEYAGRVTEDELVEYCGLRRQPVPAAAIGATPLPTDPVPAGTGPVVPAGVPPGSAG